MVQRDVASARIGRATAWLQDAESLFGRDVDAFLSATKDRDLAVFYLSLALQECIDLAAHWVADAGGASRTMRDPHSMGGRSAGQFRETWQLRCVKGWA